MKRLAAVLLCLAFCLTAFAGCSQPAESESTARPEVLPAYNPNPLTGLEKDAGYPYGKRPVAVMVNNIVDSLPQSGIAGADVIYEIVTEGGITRLMAVYSDLSKAGGYIGPVRSARDQHLQLALSYSPLFVHIGSSTTANALLETYHYEDKDLDGNASSVRDVGFWLDEKRHETRLIEHCWYTSPELIEKAVNKYGLADDKEEYDPIFKFRSYKEAPRSLAVADAGDVHIQFSGNYESDFSYNAVDGLYAKSQKGTPQTDTNNGRQLAFTNLLVLFTEITRQPDGVLSDVDYQFGGYGYYFSGGGYEAVRWTKGDAANPLRIVTEGNEELEVELNCGKTYVAVVGLDQFLNFTVGGVNPLSGTEAPSQLQQQLLDAAADASSSDAAADADSAAAEPEA